MCLSQGEDETALRQCYEGVERDGEVIRVRDTVLLRSGPRKKSLPYVAKISALWEDPKTGNIEAEEQEEGEEDREEGKTMNKYVCAWIDGGRHIWLRLFTRVCVCVPICLLRRADDESVLVLPA